MHQRCNKLIPPLQLFLFSKDPEVGREAHSAGVHSLIVDWENQGKYDRQVACDTEINLDTPEDLERLAKQVALPVTVRVNGGAQAARDAEVALELGAKILMLPMATSAKEVEAFLDHVDGRARTLIQIETQPLVRDIENFAALPWDYAFIGLHDLMISRGARWMWDPLLDGTVENVCAVLKRAGKNFGFGGVTVVGGGHPLRFMALLREMARLGCGHSCLRRTFRREIIGRNMALELEAVQAAWRAAGARTEVAKEADRLELRMMLESLRERVTKQKSLVTA